MPAIEGNPSAPQAAPELIESLKEEIARVEATRAAKESSRSAADAAFKR